VTLTSGDNGGTWIKRCDPLPLTTNLSAVVVSPVGLPIQATFSVNGVPLLTTNIPAGVPPTSTTVDFVHTYQPGSNTLELVVTDSVNEPLLYETSVIVGDIAAPEWVSGLDLSTNAFAGVVPTYHPILADDCAGTNEIVVTQNPSPGTVVTQGAHLVTLVASDPSGNRSTNNTAFKVGPVLSITSPSEYASFLATTGTPVTVQIVSNVTDVVRVNYYLDDNLVATSGDAPFGVILTNVAAGGYSLIAEAVNPDGLTSRSESVAVFFLSPESVSIQIERMTNGVVLSWPAGWTLQRAGIVTGTWSDVSGATSPYTVTTNAAPQFFRLRAGP
jgi:hypothetical protein